ncbi:hypothetical protein D9599_29275 [Roseomonas sp. KE2513]|uniref:hypothetical protein n=1 Tax=Roseomonas sp. KE2513 TaxID=2479202 RepID=UPI0018DFEE6B|nr:hypothetical protein [Roseomonas sp. KE2513]MBI0539600.1 hypothetical protein [Roseomonas sp. KE2513]
MDPLPAVSDAEVEAATTMLSITPDVHPRLPAEDLRRVVRMVLTAATQVRQAKLVRADGVAFQIGTTFSTGQALWRCTDVGTRTIVAVRIDKVITPRPLGEGQTWATDQDAADPRKLPGWLNGPPYALAEFCFDEQDIEVVEIVPREKVAVWDPAPGPQK